MPERKKMLVDKMTFRGYFEETRVEEFLTDLGRIFCKEAIPLESLDPDHVRKWATSIVGINVQIPITRRSLMITFETEEGRAIVFIRRIRGGAIGLLEWEDIDGIDALRSHRTVAHEWKPGK